MLVKKKCIHFQYGVKKSGLKTNTNSCPVIKSPFHPTAKRCGVRKHRKKEEKDKVEKGDKRKKKNILQPHFIYNKNDENK